MINLGKATAKVEILDGLPGIDREATKFNFDVSAYSYQLILNSPFFSPLLTEQVADEQETFAACFPSKRKMYVHNYLNVSNTTYPQDQNYILFTPSNKIEGAFKDVVEKGDFDPYTLIQPGNYLNITPTYIGPKWSNESISSISVPNDLLSVAAFTSWLEGKLTAAQFQDKFNQSQQEVSFSDLNKYVNYLSQETVRDGLWWAIESEDFLEENMPFWVNLRIARTPATRKHETCIVISLGIGSNDQAYDIYISQNNKPRIIDYYKGRNADYGDAPPNYRDFDIDLARVLDSQEEIEIGVMTIAGRLVVYVNKVPLIYARVNKDSGDAGGTIKEVKIAKGKIRICGTNVQAMINVCPMVFAQVSALALPIPTIAMDGTNTSNIEYMGVSNTGTFSGPVCLLPQQPDKVGKLYGVDCSQFTGDGGEASPEGIGFHKQGYIQFVTAQSYGITSLPSSNFYVLGMMPSDSTWTKGIIINGGAPYFFRLKGGASKNRDVSQAGPEIMNEVINVSQSVTAPDYFHSMSTVTVEAYNKNGIWDKLRQKQYGIRISWGWSGGLEEQKTTFTGIINSATTSEVAGKETIVLQCIDYMQILKDTPIVNSPFYDGMVAYYAIADLARRAGIQSFIKDWDSEEDYFLPSGYAFSSPKVRYEQSQKIFDCMIDMVKRFEAFIYFDEAGKLHVNRLPGGLFGQTDGSPTFQFVTNPDADPTQLILDQKNITFDLTSTINRISLMTLDRDTRNAIIYTRSATGDENNILYRKVFLINQAALGDIDVARAWAERLAERMFYPIIKASFSSVGYAGSVANIFDFISLNGQELRLMTINRKYDANSNDFTNEYSGEWLYGK